MNTPTTQPDGFDDVWAELPELLFLPLTRGKFTVIDSADWPLVAAYKWSAAQPNKGQFYAAAHDRATKCKRYMHRLIMGDPSSLVDHGNRHSLDNRRRNLRLATRHQNAVNCEARTATGLKGVYPRPARFKENPYLVMIFSGGRSHYVGVYSSKAEAAAAYDLVALKTRGEFAVLNFPDRRPEYLAQLEVQKQSA
jgi:hypothetical protein